MINTPIDMYFWLFMMNTHIDMYFWLLIHDKYVLGQACIFDWAGTVCDAGVFAPVLTFQKLFKEEGVPITTEEVRAPMGVHKRVRKLPNTGVCILYFWRITISQKTLFLDSHKIISMILLSSPIVYCILWHFTFRISYTVVCITARKILAFIVL